MISIEDSVPKRSQRALDAQDVLWEQFNDINFYVEDLGEENFYLNLLKKLFPAIELNKIFPLGGKDRVLQEARKSRSKKKVFLLDLDFDEILGRKKSLPNVFYLNRYSIENYLVEQRGIFELIKEENPKITDLEIKSKFDLTQFKKECFHLFKKLSCHFLLIQKYELGVDYLKVEPHRDCDFNSFPCCIKDAVSMPFFQQVKGELALKRPRMKYEAQLKKHYRYFSSIDKCFTKTPGKYLINYLKQKIKKIFHFSQMTIEVFKYRLMKNCSFDDLKYLKTSISAYVA